LVPTPVFSSTGIESIRLIHSQGADDDCVVSTNVLRVLDLLIHHFAVWRLHSVSLLKRLAPQIENTN
jgi:hypothetical protein